MNKKLKQELKASFDAPPPTRKAEFINSLSYPQISGLDFFFSQAGYIRKRFWCLSALMAVILIVFAKAFDTEMKAIGALSALLPLLAILSVTEISKSTSFNMEEMEMSCKFNLSRITLMRLAVIGSFHFIILLFIVLAFADRLGLGLLLYIILPFLLCTYLSLFITNHLQSKDATYICSGVTGFISLGALLLTNEFEWIYSPQFLILWSVAFIALAIVTTIEIRNLIKRTEALQCSSL